VLLGEGVMYDSKADLIYWIDITAKRLHIYNPNTKEDRSIDLPQKPGTVVSTQQSDVLLVSAANGFYYVDISTNSVVYSGIDPEPGLEDNRLNDGKVSPDGRLFVGSMHIDAATPNTGSLYRVDPSFTIHKAISPVTISNGLAWTKDGKTMYYIDSNQFNVMAYDYDINDGSLSNPREVMKVDEEWGKPDGCCIDENDNLWIAAWNGNKVVQYDPRQQKELYRLQIPSRYVTSVCFGGKDLTDLYISSASAGAGWPADYELEPFAGSLFVVHNCGVKGVASVPFAGAVKM